MDLVAWGRRSIARRFVSDEDGKQRKEKRNKQRREEPETSQSESFYLASMPRKFVWGTKQTERARAQLLLYHIKIIPHPGKPPSANRTFDATHAVDLPPFYLMFPSFHA